MEKPLYGIRAEPLRALRAVQLLELAEDRDVGLSVDCGTLKIDARI